MKIKSIRKIGKRDVYDISVEDVEHYVLKNGVITHNTGIMYSANTVFIITKSQEKDGKDLAGWSFNINIEKSRFVKEKSRIPIKVKYKTGIDVYSGLLEVAVTLGHIVKPKMGWYTRVMVDLKTGEKIDDKLWRAKESDCKTFWDDMFNNSTLKEDIASAYCIGELEEMVDNKNE